MKWIFWKKDKIRNIIVQRNYEKTFLLLRSELLLFKLNFICLEYDILSGAQGIVIEFVYKQMTLDFCQNFLRRLQAMKSFTREMWLYILCDGHFREILDLIKFVLNQQTQFIFGGTKTK